MTRIMTNFLQGLYDFFIIDLERVFDYSQCQCNYSLRE